MQIEIAASEHVNFLKNQMTWRVVERVDGQPWLDKPITLQDGTTQVSPFVVLELTPILARLRLSAGLRPDCARLPSR